MMRRTMLGIALALALTPATAMGQVSAPGATCFGGEICNNLCVSVAPGVRGWIIDVSKTDSLYCVHGFIEQQPTDTFVLMGTASVFGPDCLIGFINQDTGATAVVEVQQDFCAIQPGAVHVTAVSGPMPAYGASMADPATRNGGIVTIFGFLGAESCVDCDSSEFSGKVSRVGTETGSLKFSGRFALAHPIDLRGAVATLHHVLNEVGGAGELLRSAGAAPLPLTLHARQGGSAQTAVFETPAGQRPTIRLETKIKKGLLKVELRVDRAMIRPPTTCGSDRQTELQNVSLSLDDGTNPPIALAPTHRWACRTDRTGAVTELELVGVVEPPLMARP